MLTRRDILRQAGTATALATTASWWLVRRAHAARQQKTGRVEPRCSGTAGR